MPAAAFEPSSPAALRQWTTDVVAPPARLDYWVGAICEAFLEMDCSSREAPLFGGELQSLPVETLSINRVRASTQDVFRTPAGIARSRQLPFYLIGQAETAWHVRQDGHLAHLRPGDVVLLDSARPYELHFPEGVHCVSLQLPRAWVGQWLRQAEASGPRVAWRDQGWGQSLGALAVQLARDPTSAQALPPALMSDHLGAPLCAARLRRKATPLRARRANCAWRVQASCCAAPSWPMWPWVRLGGAAALRTLRISHAPSSAPWACRPRSGGAAADSVSKSSVSLLLRLAVLQHCLWLRA